MADRSAWVRAAVGVVVGSAFLLLLVQRVEWGTVRELLAGARAWPLVGALAALGAGLTLRIVRWWWMLRVFDPRLRPASCARPFLASLALNNTVPLRAGDVVRALGFRRALNAAPARVLGTLVIERLLDLLVLLVIFFVALMGAGRAFPRAFVMAAGVAGGVAVLALAALVLAPGMLVALAERLLAWSRIPVRWRDRAAPHLRQLAESLTVLGAPGRALGLLGLSLAAWIAEGGVFLGCAWSLGITPDPLAPWLAVGAATLATLLPSAPGYVGTFDWFATLGLTAYGIDRSAAAATALLSHLVIWLPVTVVGLAALALGRSPGTGMLRADPR